MTNTINFEEPQAKLGKLGFKFKPKAVYYCTIENPQPKKLVPDDNNYVFIPEVDRYTLVYAYK
ncbi:hypothetical protein H7R52_07075 [Weissella confusa]|uniref:Uncharacterized protein n=1 Tax=Weissella confusa TaxID=1583 RepID=A0A923NHR1_WEICO|nr:hypothetical protein [Weissella confusa]